MTRLFATAGLLALVLVGLLADFAHAQDYPNRPIRMILPFAAGGAGDTFARPLVQELSKTLGQQIVIENITGAAAQVGTKMAAGAPPDGYTLLMISNAVAINETLAPKRGYDLLKDFAPITQLNSLSLVLVANPKFQAKSVAELIALAKTEPNKLNYASSGVGSIYHLPMELLNAMAGIQTQHVPYRASGQARTDVIAGEPPMMFDGLVTMLGHIQQNQVRALGVAGSKRFEGAPDVPTIAETVPGYEADAWLGFVAPRGTPPAIVRRIRDEIANVLARPETVASYRTLGAIPVASTPEDYGVFLQKDVEKWGAVIRSAGVPIQQ
jgi:tripartite-type tricarboxylate transporter receptor subunit TctC